MKTSWPRLPTGTTCPAVTATPPSFRLPLAGSVVSLTAISVCAGLSPASAKPKSAALKAWLPSSTSVTVRLVPAGARLARSTATVPLPAAPALPAASVQPVPTETKAVPA